MRYGLIGKTLGHSYSVPIHHAFGNREYVLCELDEQALISLLSRREFCGINVTIPYKKTVMPLCDELSQDAQRIGSVNTIINRKGRLYGTNTDLYGFRALAERAGISFEGKKVAILGDGGTSFTVRTAAMDAGAGEVIVVSRRGPVRFEDRDRYADSDLVINTTPVGMYPENGERLVELADFSRLSGVLDAIYNPLASRLVDDATKQGIPAAGGLFMLVSQARRAHELFFDCSISSGKMMNVYGGVLRGHCNIVLVGMPGSGKTTVGKRIAQRTGLKFVDTDELVLGRTGKSPAELILQEGEAAFRAHEREIVAQIGKRTGQVIATGGGVPLSEENRYALRQNGYVVWLRRDTERLDTKGRPLSDGGAEALKKLERDRTPAYSKACSVSVETKEDVDECAVRIVSMWEKDYLGCRSDDTN